MFITQITWTRLPPLSSHITVTSVITDHLEMQNLLKWLYYSEWLAKKITGIQRKAHYCGTSGVSPTPQAASEVKRLISTENGKQIVHTLAVLFSSDSVGVRQIGVRLLIGALFRLSVRVKSNLYVPLCGYLMKNGYQ